MIELEPENKKAVETNGVRRQTLCALAERTNRLFKKLMMNIRSIIPKITMPQVPTALFGKWVCGTASAAKQTQKYPNRKDFFRGVSIL